SVRAGLFLSWALPLPELQLRRHGPTDNRRFRRGPSMTTDSSACGSNFVESVSRSAVRSFRSTVFRCAVRGVARIALVLPAAMLSLPAAAQDVKAAQDGAKPYKVVA